MGIVFFKAVGWALCSEGSLVQMAQNNVLEGFRGMCN